MRLLLALFALYASRALALGTDPVYTFSVEFVTGSFTNVTTKVERGSWSQALIDLFQSPSAKPALFELSNEDGSLSPRKNTNLKPGKAMQLTATYGGSSYPLFYGRITEVSLSPVLGQRTTLVQGVDDWERVSRLNYTTPYYSNVPVQSVFCVLMSLSSVRSFSADSTIVDVVANSWYRDAPAAQALQNLVRSYNLNLIVDGNGTYYLRDRYWSLFSTSINTYSVADDLRFSLSADSVINQMKMNSTPRLASSNISTVAAIPQAILVPASSAVGFWLAYQDPSEPSADIPVSSYVTPISSTDYYATTNSDGSGSVVTANLSLSFTGFAASAVCSLFNGSGTDAWLTRFQVRGYPVRRLAPLGVQIDISSSQSSFGVKNITVDNALTQDRTFMENLSKTVTTERKDGRDSSAYSLTNEFPDILNINQGGLLNLVDNFSGYSLLWRVRGTDHSIELASGLRHSTKYDLEAYDALPYLVLDSATMGQLNNGRILAI